MVSLVLVLTTDYAAPQLNGATRPPPAPASGLPTHTLGHFPAPVFSAHLKTAVKDCVHIREIDWNKLFNDPVLLQQLHPAEIQVPIAKNGKETWSAFAFKDKGFKRQAVCPCS